VGDAVISRSDEILGRCTTCVKGAGKGVMKEIVIGWYLWQARPPVQLHVHVLRFTQDVIGSPWSVRGDGGVVMKKHYQFQLLFVALLVASVTTFTQAEEIVDRGTARQGMHACPVGMYMTGIHVGNNWLLCESISPGYAESEEHPDTTTVDFNMHVCPSGTAMTGIHVGNNLLLCAPLRDGSSLRYVDTSTSRQNMHACPPSMAMTGIHVGNNQLLCQYKS
jgi:hypothetical protein